MYKVNPEWVVKTKIKQKMDKEIQTQNLNARRMIIL